MSLRVRPLRGLGMKCQLKRSLSLNVKPAVASWSGERHSRNFRAPAAMALVALATSGGGSGASARAGEFHHRGHRAHRERNRRLFWKRRVVMSHLLELELIHVLGARRSLNHLTTGAWGEGPVPGKTGRLWPW